MSKSLHIIVAVIIFFVLLPNVLSYRKNAGNNGEEEDKSETLEYDSTFRDTDFIASTCKMFETIQWSKEEIERFTGFDTIGGHIVQREPFIVFKRAPRDFDTVVNYYRLVFTTEY